MALERIAQGSASSLRDIAQYDRAYLEGQRGELHIAIRQIPFFPDLPPGFITALQVGLDRVPGLEVGRVRFGDDNIIRIPFRRGVAPLVLIAAILAIFFVGAILLLVTLWALFREQFEQVLAEFRTIVRRLELIEDRLDRKDRPYGDGTRHDSRRR